VIPFVLKNALSIFSRVVVEEFKEFIHKLLEVYLHDWTMFILLKDQIENLHLILDRCGKYKIYLNLEKSIVCALFSILLSHVVCKKILLVDLMKIVMIVYLPPLTLV
jgi:hypothetical protein